jgi:hypothetical protein
MTVISVGRSQLLDAMMTFNDVRFREVVIVLVELGLVEQRLVIVRSRFIVDMLAPVAVFQFGDWLR